MIIHLVMNEDDEMIPKRSLHDLLNAYIHIFTNHAK